MLLEFERRHAAYLDSQKYARVDEKEIEQFQRMLVVARVILYDEDVKSRNFAIVKIEFLSKGDKTISAFANFSECDSVLLYPNQLAIL